jgi:16S rRNA U516 pseudouridylate synthase RsuA-like enzyme
MSEERLQKILARAGVASRRKVEELIVEGRVTVNGKVAVLGDKAETSTDSIKVDGKRIMPQTHFHYLVLNKPKGSCRRSRIPKGGRP